MSTNSFSNPAPAGMTLTPNRRTVAVVASPCLNDSVVEIQPDEVTPRKPVPMIDLTDTPRGPIVTQVTLPVKGKSKTLQPPPNKKVKKAAVTANAATNTRTDPDWNCSVCLRNFLDARYGT